MIKDLRKIISVKEVLENTDVLKVMRCYDFKPYEKEEVLNMRNKNGQVLSNEEKWRYIKETLLITSDNVQDIGNMVRDIIDDMKMGYHRLDDGIIERDICTGDVPHEVFEEMEEMKFEYEILSDYETDKITHIVIYYNKENVTETIIEKEICEIVDYLNI